MWGRCRSPCPKNGKLEGLWTYWSDQGHKMMEGEYKNGVAAGRWCYWRDSGQKWKEGTLMGETPEGRWTYWSKDGFVDPEQSGIYKDGKKVASLPRE